MRLTVPLVALAVGFVLRPTLALSTDVAAQKGAPMAGWKTSATWRKYKAFWGAVPTLKTPTSLRQAQQGAAALKLTEVFPDSPEVTANLKAALDDRLAAQAELLDRSLWKGDKRVGEKRVPYDPTVTLGHSVQLLGHDAGALRGLRRLQIPDPWIAEVLVPAVEGGCQSVETRIAAVERWPEARAKGWGGGGAETPLDPEAQALIADARSAVQSARSVLAVEPDAGH